MNEPPHCTLLVHIDNDIIFCDVLSVEHSAVANVWVVLLDTPELLDSDRYAHCTLCSGELQTPGSCTILDHIVDTERGFFYTKGLFHPRDAIPTSCAN
jgi:hypothetical protein